MTDHPRAEPHSDSVMVTIAGETHTLSYWQALKLRDELHEALEAIRCLAWVI